MELKIRNLHKKYGKNIVLNNLSLDFVCSKRYAIVGSNGAGKSTLIRIISGIDEDYTGEISYNGENLRDIAPKDRAKIVSYMKQGQSNNLPYTVRELLLNARYTYTGLFSKYNKADIDAVNTAMSQTNTTDFAERQINELSGGQAQRVWLAFSLVQQSHWLALDEPISALDIKYQNEFINILNKIYNNVICIIHDINFASLYFDEIIALKDGKVIYNDRADNFINQKNIKELFEVDVNIISHPELNKKISFFY